MKTGSGSLVTDGDYKESCTSLDQRHFFLAVEEDKPVFVRQMLSTTKILVNATDKNGWTALHVASYFSCLDVIKVLLETNAVNVNVVNDKCQSPLHMAVKQNSKSAVKALLKVTGININQQDDYGNTALHYAIRNNNPDILEKLLAVPKVDVNLTDRLERTPLLLASELDHYICAVLLLKCGPDLEVINYTGLTSLQVAEQGGHDDIVFILDHGLMYFQGSNNKVPNTESNILQKLLEEVEDANQATRSKHKILKLQPEITELFAHVKRLVTDYIEDAKLTLDKYLYMLSHIATKEHVQRLLDVWNCDFLRPRIPACGLDAVYSQRITQCDPLDADYSETSTQGQKLPASEQLAPTLRTLKEKLYTEPGIKEYVQEVYEDSGLMFVNIEHGKTCAVKEFVIQQCGDIDVTYIEQEAFDDSIFLTGNDHSKFVEKPGIGPGSCIVKVGKAFVDDVVLAGRGQNLTFGDMLLCGSLSASAGEAAAEAAAELKERQTGASSVEEAAHGTLGCLAQVHTLGKKNLYGLSANHILGLQDRGEIKRDGVFVITGIKVTETVDASIQGVTNETFAINFQDTVCLSDKYVGVHREENSRHVDVVLLGPVHKHLLETHQKFVATVDKEVNVYQNNGQSYEGKYVKKMGAVTRLTNGRVLSYMKNKGLFVVVPKTGEVFADVGDSGALVLLDEEPGLIGMGLVYRKALEFKKGTNVYKDAVYCVRLDYCIDVLYDALKLNKGRDQIKLYYGHVVPNVGMTKIPTDSV